MKKFITIIFISLSVLCKAQDGRWEEYTDSAGHVLMTITPKNDTIIGDTMALVRSLLRQRNNFNEIIQAYHEQLYKAKKTLESINSIMFWKPKENDHGIL